MTRARPAAMLAIGAAVGTAAVTFLGAPPARATSLALEPVRVILVVLPGISFEQAMALPGLRLLAASGGAGLMTTRAEAPSGAGRSNDQDLRYLVVGDGADPPTARTPPTLLARELDAHGLEVCLWKGGAAAFSPAATFAIDAADVMHVCPIQIPRKAFVVVDGSSPADAADLVPRLLGSFEGGRSMVVVVAPSTSPAMDRVGDEVTPVIVASGPPGTLLPGSRVVRSLTSDSTRQTGLVSNVDVAPTILHFLGIPVPGEMDGQPIRVAGDEAPFAIHRLHLEQRRIRLPIQMGELAFVAMLGILAIPALVLLGMGRTVAPTVVRFLGFLTMCGLALPLVVAAAGLLPHLTYVWVLPFLFVSIPAMAALAVRWRGGPLRPAWLLGAAGLSFVVVDLAFFGGRAFRVPILGGTMLDGVRFYGLPNVFIPLLLASALFVAAGLPPRAGAGVLIGAGLLAGFPALGANVGAAVTLLAAAGLWRGLRAGGRLGLRELAVAAGVVVAGLAVVLLANRYLSGTPTHATRFVERTGGRLGSAFDTFWSRLEVGFHQFTAVPAAVIPMIGLLVVLALAIRPVGPVARGLADAGERWRDALVVLVLASVVAYVANDTGVSAAAPAFLHAAAGMAYPAFVALRRDRSRER